MREKPKVKFVFALGIVAKSPQRSEDLQRIARPDEGGERPKLNKMVRLLRSSQL